MAQETTTNRVKRPKVKSTSISSRPVPVVQNDERRTFPNWRAPAIMFASLLTGLAAALGHHFVNASLHGKQVDQAGLSQTWTSRFGTALAFLVKMFFVVSVGVAFAQRQWLNFHRNAYKIEEIDSLTGILGNILNFSSGLVWLRNPILTIIALVSWTIPFAAVVAPGSLLVQPEFFSYTTQAQVPQASFNISTYAQAEYYGGLQSPSDLVSKIAYVAAMSGQPVTLPSAHQNQTYHLDFFGPAIRCSSAKQTMIQTIAATIAETGKTGSPVVFVSWTGHDDHGLLNLDNVKSGWPLSDGSWDLPYEPLDKSLSDAARIYVMTNMHGVTDPHVAECLLHNASYSVDFTFQYPQQNIKSSILRYVNPISGTDLSGVVDKVGNLTGSAIYSYMSVMGAFGKLLVGASRYGGMDRGTVNTVFSSYLLLNIHWEGTNNIHGVLEELFQNITLSMLSNDTLIKDAAQADWVSVNVTSYPITYVYKPRDLFLAYGLSLLCTLACSIIGVHALWINNASYQNIFSTFVRVTGDRELHSLTDENDHGADPVPKALAEAKIIMEESARRMPAPKNQQA